ncbi:uncharacterized protein LOC108928959, partial [Arapaima gigas]
SQSGSPLAWSGSYPAGTGFLPEGGSQVGSAPLQGVPHTTGLGYRQDVVFPDAHGVLGPAAVTSFPQYLSVQGFGPHNAATGRQMAVSQDAAAPGQTVVSPFQVGYPYSHGSSAPAQLVPMAGALPSQTGGSHVGFSVPGLQYPSVLPGVYGMAPPSNGTTPSMGYSGGAIPGQAFRFRPVLDWPTLSQAGSLSGSNQWKPLGYSSGQGVGSQFGHLHPGVGSVPSPAVGGTVPAWPTNFHVASAHAHPMSATVRHPRPHFPVYSLAGAAPHQTVVSYGSSLPTHTVGSTAHVAHAPSHFMHVHGVASGTDLDSRVRSPQGTYTSSHPLGSQTIGSPAWTRVPPELCLCLKDFVLPSRL